MRLFSDGQRVQQCKFEILRTRRFSADVEDVVVDSEDVQLASRCRVYGETGERKKNEGK